MKNIMIPVCFVAAMMTFVAPQQVRGDGADDPFAVEVTGLVAAATDLDWNGDDMPDRFVLVRNKTGDAIDMFVTMSDASSNTFGPTGVIRAILPTTPRDEQTLHTIGHGITSDPQPLRPILQGRTSALGIEVALAPSPQGWQIETLRSYYHGEGSANGTTCFFDYQTGRALVSRVRQDAQPVDIGPVPDLAPYWWQEAVPEVCLR